MNELMYAYMHDMHACMSCMHEWMNEWMNESRLFQYGSFDIK